MKVEIIDREFKVTVLGFSGIAADKDYTGTAFKLMDKMWQVIRAENIKHKGLNIWVYEPGECVFAGVEPENPMQHPNGLEQKTISLKRYAYYKHTGPYQLIKQAGRQMRNELQNRGIKPGSTYIEIYGHWTKDESKLETELFMEVNN